MAIACKGGLPEWRRNLTHELNLDDKPECNNEYGEEEVDEDGHHYDREDDDDDNMLLTTALPPLEMGPFLALTYI